MAKKKKKNKPNKQNVGPLWVRVLKIGLKAIALGLFLLFLLFGAVYIGLFGSLPTDDDLRSIKTDNASEIYASDQVLLGKYFVKNRTSISYGDIPEVVINALVATEDSRFFEHEGIDFYSIPRVVIKTVLLGDNSAGGGSTISQQLIKNLYGRSDHGALSMPVNKLKENITALKLEELFTKEEIITMYLNTVSFGENVYGIKAAAQRYFDKSPKELKIEEAATLVGMLKANTTYNPRLHPEASKERRNTVLALMVREGSLDPELLDDLQEKPLELDYRRLEGQFGPAPYLRARLEPEINEILKSKTKADGSPYNLYSDGLRIELTVNSVLQEHAEKVLKEQMKYLQKVFEEHWKGRTPWGKNEDFLWKQAVQTNRYKRLQAAGKTDAEIRAVFKEKTKLLIFTHEGFKVSEMSPLDSVAYHQMILQAGFIAMDSRNGDVLAYVGGIDFGSFPYDHVKSKRQVGSTFKPFVYAAALEQGIEPCDYIENERIVFSDYENWSPENSNGVYGGLYTVKGGLANSVNTVAANLIAETGPEKVRELARRLGVESGLPKVPAIALGVADLSLYEMVKAYAPFSNGGKKIKPRFISKITAADGTVLFDSKPNATKEVLTDYNADAMRLMLELVVDSGTARSVKGRYGVRTPVGGKTGTTQNNADGWFMAITPKVVCGAWVGAQSPLVRFRSTSLGQGAATALPIVAGWLKETERDRSVPNILGRSFPEIPVEIAYDMDCELYIESRIDNFLENLFDGDSRRSRRSRRGEAKSDSTAVEISNPDSNESWINRLLDKLKKE